MGGGGKEEVVREDLVLWASRIRDDLDPHDFSVREMTLEFGMLAEREESEGYRSNTESYIRRVIRRLRQEKYIEKIAKGRYALTQSGDALADEA